MTGALPFSYRRCGPTQLPLKPGRPTGLLIMSPAYCLGEYWAPEISRCLTTSPGKGTVPWGTHPPIGWILRFMVYGGGSHG